MKNTETVLENKYPLKIIPRNQHHISRKNISENALKVLYRLNKAGFKAYLVGGSVRDLLIDKQPKDFDITTNATPEQMYRLFRNCRLVGRRFRLAHVIFGSETIEVATFRRHHQTILSRENKNITSLTDHNGMVLRDNIFGSIEEDAHRRDFSINSLYYNITDFTLHDYTGGLKDLQKRTIRLIGIPEIRYREDPVRMLRAIRFAAKLNMTINYETAKPIPKLAILLRDVSPARLFEETLKLFQTGYGEITYHLLCKYQLFQLLFPSINKNFTEYSNICMEKIILSVLSKNDLRLRNNMGINSAFLFAVILWYPLLEHTQKLTKESNLSYFNAFSLAINYVLNEQCRTLAIPKRLTNLIRDIWQLQLYLLHYNGKRAFRIIDHSRFHIAYNLLALRATVENNIELQKLSYWWREFQIATVSCQKNTLTRFYSDIEIHTKEHRLYQSVPIHGDY